MEVEILRHDDHVALLLIEEVHALPESDAPQPCQRSHERDGVGRRQTAGGELARRSEQSHAERTASRDAELDLVQ